MFAPVQNDAVTTDHCSDGDCDVVTEAGVVRYVALGHEIAPASDDSRGIRRKPAPTHPPGSPCRRPRSPRRASAHRIPRRGMGPTSLLTRGAHPNSGADPVAAPRRTGPISTACGPMTLSSPSSTSPINCAAGVCGSYGARRDAHGAVRASRFEHALHTVTVRVASFEARRCPPDLPEIASRIASCSTSNGSGLGKAYLMLSPSVTPGRPPRLPTHSRSCRCGGRSGPPQGVGHEHALLAESYRGSFFERETAS